MLKIIQASYYAALVRGDLQALKFWAALFLEFAPQAYINRRASWPERS